MDHISSCMLSASSVHQGHQQSRHIERQSASPTVDQLPQQLQQIQLKQPPPPPPPQPDHPQEKSHAWRMHSQTERKYQLFPKEKPQPTLALGKGLDPEQAFVLAMGQNSNALGAEKTAAASNGLRLRIKEHNLTRRRKISVPELGPMTTVQEIPMDSPTIPGRPPLHERSISAPGHSNSWRQHHLVDCMVPQPAYEEIQELFPVSENPIEPPRCNSAQAVLSPSAAKYAARANSVSQRPLSPRNLAPLVIPPAPTSQPPAGPPSSRGSRARQSSNPTDSSRSACSDDSPHNHMPFTPSSPPSTTSTLPTPLSAAIPVPPAESRTSPKLRALAETNYAVVISTTTSGNHTSAADDEPTLETPKVGTSATSGTESSTSALTRSMSTKVATLGHRRGQSESGSIMERGRPRKRSASRDGASTSLGLASSTSFMTGTTAPAAASAVSGSVTASPGSTSTLKRTASKTSRSAERRAFELLPRGFKATETPLMLGMTQAAALAAQALQQAARFEVLRREDVESLSRELRNLDERTEYLRRTYTSLRAGRRNLHSRICQHLRSPRVARFSHESMLRQEEALAELDASIDDWVTKLEQAENRRTRVRQKLLEHVAAAATLPLMAPEVTAAVASAGGSIGASAAPSGSATSTVFGVSETLQKAMGLSKAGGRSSPVAATAGILAGNISTPPRSPAKVCFPLSTTATTGYGIVTPVSSSPSPQRPIVAQVPSTILEQPMIEEAMAIGEREERMKAEAAASEMSPAEVTSPLNVMSSPVQSLSSRHDVESIRIYAGDDVYALLADVESQFTHIGGSGSGNNTDNKNLHQHAGLSEEEYMRLHRAHSHEILNGSDGENNATAPETSTPMTTTPTTAIAPTPLVSKPSPMRTAEFDDDDEDEIFLTNAVFRPERSVLAI